MRYAFRREVKGPICGEGKCLRIDFALGIGCAVAIT
jgi:hypothetical protein